MAEDEILRQTRQYYIDKLNEKALEIRPLISRIATFDQDLNETTDVVAIIMGDASATTFSATIGAGRTGGVRVKLREDEFTGKTYIEAARSYLERIGHAVSMEELLDAFKKGGSPVGGRAPKKTLYISLARSKEFAPIPGQVGFIGLRKWYPNLKAGAEKKGTDKKHKK
jgi:hypothetical protein